MAGDDARIRQMRPGGGIPIHMRSRLSFGTYLGVALVAAGCGQMKLGGTLLPNQPPAVQLTQVPAPGDTAGTYAYEVSWAGTDPDGRVVAFYYAVDPPGRALADTAWVRTTDNRKLFVFSADSVGSGVSTRARRFHTIAVKCEDDHGAFSSVATASFTSTTIAPTILITLPLPNKLLARAVAPVIRVEWQGNDPDGLGSTQPVSYRWKLFGASSEFTPIEALADPDSLRRFYAPSFAGWDSLGGDVRSVDLRDLVVNQDYLFVVVAFDQAGAYSPVFTGDSNMLQFRVDPSASLGPQITFTNSAITYTFPSGGYFTDPNTYVRADFAADVPVQLGWSARPSPGGFIRSYRWAVDLSRLDDDTPRSDEVTDLRHWSRPSPDGGIVLPPFSPGAGRFSETHRFYLEAEDDLHLKSLGVLEFTAVRAVFDKDLLVVDDTWLTFDRAGTAGCVRAPTGVWPTAAELDTFLYAAGGKPWRCYPAGTPSPVGVFAGYAFDTVATHFARPAVFNLQKLDRYRNVVWMTDVSSALVNTNDPYTTISPMPILRYWSTPGVANPLATWLQQGGRLWLMGGGAALASLAPFDAPHSPNNVFSAALGELGQGRLMYDEAHWRSEVKVLRTVRAARSARAVGGWPGAPDYSALPDVLIEKTPDVDPQSPLRTGNTYPGSYAAEYLSKPNVIVESPDPGHVAPASTLDTLYETQGGEAGSGWPVMTVYHGTESALFVFSGFPIWYFQRSQTIALTDFVLQRVWGMNRKPVPR